MIDAHCHMCSDDFAEDLEQVVERAKDVNKSSSTSILRGGREWWSVISSKGGRVIAASTRGWVEAGVVGCLVNTETVGELGRCLGLGRAYPGFLVPCAGVHPVQYERRRGEGGEEELWGRCARMDDLKFTRAAGICLEGLDEWVDEHQESLVALGEVGLDFSPRYIHEDGDKEVQRNVLRHQIALGKKYNLPLVSHSRSAGKPTIDEFIQHGATDVCLHAFDGSLKSAKPGIQAGFYFSIPPCIVRGEEKQKLVKGVPIEQLLLETDSPVLGPTKEERNEPKNLIISAEWIAKLKGLTTEEVIRITTENAHRLFPKLKTLMAKA